jgi:hydroxylamine reductase
LKGVCGKDAQTAGLQDLQLHFNIGLAQWADAVVSKGGRVSERTKEVFLDTTFATLTNVNFDAERFYGYLKETNDLRNGLKEQAAKVGVDASKLQGPAQFQYKVKP